MTSLQRMMIALMLGSVAACGSAIEKPGDEEPSRFSTEFRLVNVGSSSIYLGESRMVTVLADGEPIAQGCSTQSDPSDEPGVSATRIEIRPGDEQSMTKFGELDPDDDCTSYGEHAGETLEAEFCWFTNFEGVGVTQSTPRDRVCQTTSFVVGEVDTVTFEVDSTIEPTAGTMPIAIENGTEGSIYVQTARNCAGDPYYEVTFGDEVVFPTRVCGVCDCSESPCGIGCDAACEMDSVAEIASGSERIVDMPLVYPRRYDTDQNQCTQQQFVPHGPLVATICHGTTVEEANEGAQVTDEVCEDLEFTLDDDEVRLVVD